MRAFLEWRICFNFLNLLSTSITLLRGPSLNCWDFPLAISFDPEKREALPSLSKTMVDRSFLFLDFTVITKSRYWKGEILTCTLSIWNRGLVCLKNIPNNKRTIRSLTKTKMTKHQNHEEFPHFFLFDDVGWWGWDKGLTEVLSSLRVNTGDIF